MRKTYRTCQSSDKLTFGLWTFRKYGFPVLCLCWAIIMWKHTGNEIREDAVWWGCDLSQKSQTAFLLLRRIMQQWGQIISDLTTSSFGLRWLTFASRIGSTASRENGERDNPLFSALEQIKCGLIFVTISEANAGAARSENQRDGNYPEKPRGDRPVGFNLRRSIVFVWLHQNNGCVDQSGDIWSFSLD